MDSRQWPGSHHGVKVFLLGPSNCTSNAGRSRPAHSKPVAVCCSRDGTHAPNREVSNSSTATSGMTPFGTHQTWVSTGEIRTARAPRVKQCAQTSSKPTAPSSYWISSKVCKRGFSAPAAAPCPPPEAGAFFKTQKPFPRVATSRFHSEHLVYSHEWSN